MKIALVYDRVNKFGGAERVLRTLHKIYPGAPLYTLVHSPTTALWAKDFDVRPTFFNKVEFLQTRHELLAPLAAMAFETIDFSGFDVVISVTSADAKAIITKPQTLHICYCLTPTRYLWSGKNYYHLPGLILKWAQRADLIFANRPDVYLAISDEVKKRIKTFYKKDSEVIYPSIDYDFFSKTKKTKGDYYLLVGRLVPYKKPDIVINAFNKLKYPLVVAGIGSQFNYLKSISRNNIDFVGEIDDKKLRRLYAGANALIFPQVEDFGLVPLEAQAAGTPVLAFGEGGTLETVIDGQTGLFFQKQNPESIIAAINRFESKKHAITGQKCRQQAALFSEDRFISSFSAKVSELWQKHQKANIS